MFGRDPDACDVVYPPDAAIVSRRHFAFVRKPSGAWTFDLFGGPFVAVDGTPADLGAPVRSGAVIELGADGGPSFEIVIPALTALDSMPKTLAQRQVIGSRAAASQAQRTAARARRFAVGGSVATALIAAAVVTLFYVSGGADRRFERELQALRERQDRLAADSIPREHRDRLAQAAYHVVIGDGAGREHWAGTAFPIGPDLLATNAHVAINREQPPAGGKLLVRAPGAGGRTWEVVWHKLHPGYKALVAFLGEDPLLVETIKSEENPWGAQFLTAGNSYDVALMRIEGPHLSPVIEVASREEAGRLSAGDPLAYAGYPSQNIAGSELQRLGPTPQVRTGLVTAMTDLFTMPAEPRFRRLVHHNLGTTVGTSGSPIIGASGRVVALHNRSTYVTSGDGPSVPIAVVAYAQRADLLVDLVDGRAETTLDQERAYWSRQTAVMRRGVDVIVPAILDAHRPRAGATPLVASQERLTLTATDRIRTRDADGAEAVQRRKSRAFKVRGGERHLFLVYAQKATHVGAYLSVDGKIVAKQTGERWYPAINYTAAADASVEVSVVGPDEEVTYALTDYVWDAPKF